MIRTAGTRGSSGAMVLLVFLPFGSLHAQNAAPEECEWTRHAQIYSSANYIEETSDVVGQELALWVHEDKSVEARLYDYEGSPNTEGIRLTGKISGRKLNLRGVWIQHLIDEPSHQETEQRWDVEVVGTLNANSFRGTAKIAGIAHRETMKRAKQIWMCPTCHGTPNTDHRTRNTPARELCGRILGAGVPSLPYDPHLTSTRGVPWAWKSQFGKPAT